MIITIIVMIIRSESNCFTATLSATAIKTITYQIKYVKNKSVRKHLGNSFDHYSQLVSILVKLQLEYKLISIRSHYLPLLKLLNHSLQIRGRFNDYNLKM